MIADDGGSRIADRRSQTIATLITVFQVVWQIICLPDELLSVFLRAYLFIYFFVFASP